MSKKLRILAVEDDYLLLKVLGQMLEEAGFEVALARNGRIALDLVESFQPQVILLDMMMPLMDGAAFIAELSSGPGAAVPIVALSASLKSGDQVSGAAVSLAKPVSRDDILAAVRGLLG